MIKTKVSRVGKKTVSREQIFIVHNEGFISLIQREHLQVNKRKIKQTVEKQARDINRQYIENAISS